MQDFFNREIKNGDAKDVIAIMQLLFKDIKVGRMRRYFVEAFTKHVKIPLYSFIYYFIESVRL